MKIRSAMTTCPRPGADYLIETLLSLQDAGFNPCIVNDTEFAGSWPNLRRALGLLTRPFASDPQPDDAMIVFQDDILVARGLAGWFSRNGWPAPVETIGVVSFYTSTANHLRPGWFTLDDLAVYRPNGALALAFPRHAAEKLLADPPNLAFRTGSDTSTATFCRRHNLAWYMHSPSFVEHIGVVSSMGDPRPITIPDRCAGQFVTDVSHLS